LIGITKISLVGAQSDLSFWVPLKVVNSKREQNQWKCGIGRYLNVNKREKGEADDEDKWKRRARLVLEIRFMRKVIEMIDEQLVKMGWWRIIIHFLHVKLGWSLEEGAQS
jgi:hypothetical protein